MPRLLLSLCLLACVNSAHVRELHNRPLLQAHSRERSHDVEVHLLQRLRGGARHGRANGAAEARARLLLLVSNAGFGSYSVFLRALGQVPGAVPLGTVFITFVRYNILFFLATVTRTIHALQAKQRTQPKRGVDMLDAAHLAAFELAFYSVACALLSVWGTCRVTAAMSEIFASMDNLSRPPTRLLAPRPPLAPYPERLVYLGQIASCHALSL